MLQDSQKRGYNYKKNDQSVFYNWRKTMPRVSPQYEQTQQQRIIAGAAQVFADHGYRQTTIDQISQALQLSKGAIYIYFKSKEELYVSVLQSIYERRFAALSTAYQVGDPLSTKFEKISDRLSGMLDHDDYVFIRLSLEGFLESEHIPSLQAIKTASYQRFYKLLYALFEEGQLTGEISPELNLPSVITVLLALSDGLMLHSLVQDRGIDPERVRRILHETFSQALGYRSEK
jgi:AcrR family transcriptional regulator